MTHYDSLIFSAAGAFVSLQRPGRADADRLDALALPLLERLSVEGKRRIAAVLGECRSIIPEGLVAALVVMPLDISASLLISRAEIPDTTLERAIQIGGEPHAKVIALKHNLSAAVKTRIDNFIQGIVHVSAVSVTPIIPRASSTPALAPKANAQTELELAQDRLRNMMMRKTLSDPVAHNPISPFALNGNTNIVAKLINLALEGDADFLSTALADEWSAPYSAVRPLIKRNSLHSLAVLLKGREFGASDTFAVVSAFNPSAFGSREAIASFYLKFQAIGDLEIKALTLPFFADTAINESIGNKVA